MQINKLYRKYGFAKNGWPHLYKDHISSCSSSERSQAIFAYKHEFTFQKKVVAVFPLWFLFPIQMRCTDRRIWKNRIPRIASKSILLSLWLTSSLLREDGSHHIFSQYLESFFAWSLIWKIDLFNWEYLFFPHSCRSLKNPYHDNVRLHSPLYTTQESNTVVYSMLHCSRNLDRRIILIFNKKIIFFLHARATNKQYVIFHKIQIVDHIYFGAHNLSYSTPSFVCIDWGIKINDILYVWKM